MDFYAFGKRGGMPALIESKRPAVAKMVASLGKYKIGYSEDDGMGNALFTRGDRECRVAHEMFFRSSGRCVMVGTDRKTGRDAILPMCDADFYEYMMMIVLHSLGVETV